MGGEIRKVRFSFSEFKEENDFRNEEGEKLSYLQQVRLYHDTKRLTEHDVYSPSGNCMWCDKTNEQLMPVRLRLCPDCAIKFTQRHTIKEKLKMEKKIIYGKFCEYCGKEGLGKDGQCWIVINARLCISCHNKYAKRVREHRLTRTEKMAKKTIKEIVSPVNPKNS